MLNVKFLVAKRIKELSQCFRGQEKIKEKKKEAIVAFWRSIRSFPFWRSVRSFPFWRSVRSFPFWRSIRSFPFWRSVRSFPFWRSVRSFPFANRQNWWYTCAGSYEHIALHCGHKPHCSFHSGRHVLKNYRINIFCDVKRFILHVSHKTTELFTGISVLSMRKIKPWNSGDFYQTDFRTKT